MEKTELLATYQDKFQLSAHYILEGDLEIPAILIFMAAKSNEGQKAKN